MKRDLLPESENLIDEIQKIAELRSVSEVTGQILSELEKEISHKRFQHTLKVAFIADRISLFHYGEDASIGNAAFLASLLHDITKEKSVEEHLRILSENDAPIDWMNSPEPVLHSRSAKFIARSRFQITDDSILNAISWHTTGHPGMDTTARIVYTSDFLSHYDWKKLQELIQEPVDNNCLTKVKNTMVQLIESEREIMLDTLQLYQTLIST